MILNILMMILIFILTIYEIISINIIYMFWSDLSKHFTDWFFIILVYWIFILWAYLIYVLFHWLYKKTIHKNYWYAYGAFFVILIIYYFWYFTNYDKEPIIPESIFETKLQNIEVKTQENWFVQLWKIQETHKQELSTLSDLDKQTSSTYLCITWDWTKKCEKSDLNASLEIYKTNKPDIEILNNEISKLTQYNYFKQEISEDFPSLHWLTALSRTSLLTAIYELQEWNQQKAINSLLIYKKLWDKLLEWDNSLVWIIIWLTIQNITNSNINYIIDNFELDRENMTILNNELRNLYNSQEIITNTIKIEYHLNKSGFTSWVKDWLIKSSMLFDMDEFFNEMRREKLAMIKWEENFKISYSNYFKRRYLYKFLLWFSTFSIESYKADFDKLNADRKNILEKIDEK